MKIAILSLALIGAAGLSVEAMRHNGTGGAGQTGGAASRAVELGLDPASLAVSGFDAEGAELLLQRLAGETSLQADFAAAKAESHSAAAAFTSAAEALAQDPGDPELRRAFSAAGNQCAAADSRLTAVRASLQDSACRGESSNRMAPLERCQLTRCCRMPASFRVLDRNEQQLGDIQQALIAEARAQRRGEDMDEYAAQLLASVRAEFGVIEANQRLATHLTAIEAVFAEN